jgi:lysophospholipase L1-like esterase
MMHTPQLFYTALGDSLTVGVGAVLKSGFVKDYTRLSENTLRRKIIVNKYARSKVTSYEFIHYLTNPIVRESIYHANLITITIGGNDLIQANRHYQKTNDRSVFNQALQVLKINLEIILKTISHIKTGTNSPYLIRVLGLYNPYPYISYSHYWLTQFNHTIAKVTNSYGGKFIDIYPLFTRLGDRVLSLDTLHPNSFGYHILAQELYRSGYDELF